YKAKNRFEQNQPPRAIKFCLEAAMVPTLHRERDILDRLMSVESSKWSNRIVRLYGYALEAHPPFLVYEYVPGGDLTSHLTAKRLRTNKYPSAAAAARPCTCPPNSAAATSPIRVTISRAWASCGINCWSATSPASCTPAGPTS